MKLHAPVSSDEYLVDFPSKASNAAALQIQIQASIDAIGGAIPTAEILSLTLRGGGLGETYVASLEVSAVATGNAGVVLASAAEVQCYEAGSLDGLGALLEGSINGDPGFPPLGGGGLKEIYVTDYAIGGGSGSHMVAAVLFSTPG